MMKKEKPDYKVDDGPLSAEDMQDLLNMVRKLAPKKIAEELVSVQPMNEAGKALGELIELLQDGGVLTITSKRVAEIKRSENE